MQVIDMTSDEYPALLREVPDRPKKLYYLGNWDPSLFRDCLAVVGSRRRTDYGRRVCTEITRELAASGVTIVSGFMFGIDADAHAAALDAGGRTIAVMPCGADVIHPAHQKKLYQQVTAQGGLIISEYPPGATPDVWTYPRRNRIVAGLSQATLVIEAEAKSGSMITAQLTLDYDRELFAVPGPVDSRFSEGTLALIKDGAQLARCSEDILGFYGKARQGRELSSFIATLDTAERAVADLLMRGPQSADELARASGQSVSGLAMLLSLLQMKGLVEMRHNRYALVKERRQVCLSQ
jgi:DNA processing protein